MKLRRFVAVGMSATLLGLGGAGVASAEEPAPQVDVYQVAASAGDDDGVAAQPQAIPGIVAIATIAARGFVAARAPQQVAQVARAAGFLSALGLFGASQIQSNEQLALEKAYFDR